MSGFIGYYVETTANSSPESKHKQKKQTYFLICQSCFWCASASNLYLPKNRIISKCPLCHGNRISAVQVSKGQQNEYT